MAGTVTLDDLLKLKEHFEGKQPRKEEASRKEDRRKNKQGSKKQN